MRKTVIIILAIVLILSVAVPAMGQRGNPETERSGEQSGQAQQSGPGGPRYGNPTPEPTPAIIQTPTAPKSEEGRVYRLFLPIVCNRAVEGKRAVEYTGRVSWY